MCHLVDRRHSIWIFLINHNNHLWYTNHSQLCFHAIIQFRTRVSRAGQTKSTFSLNSPNSLLMLTALCHFVSPKRRCILRQSSNKGFLFCHAMRWRLWCKPTLQSCFLLAWPSWPLMVFVQTYCDQLLLSFLSCRIKTCSIRQCGYLGCIQFDRNWIYARQTSKRYNLTSYPALFVSGRNKENNK